MESAPLVSRPKRRSKSNTGHFSVYTTQYRDRGSDLKDNTGLMTESLVGEWEAIGENFASLIYEVDRMHVRN